MISACLGKEWPGEVEVLAEVLWTSEGWAPTFYTFRKVDGKNGEEEEYKAERIGERVVHRIIS